MLLQFILHVIGYDIWFYVSHLMLHTRLLWWVHKIHHEKVRPTFADTHHGHWFESVFQSAGFLLPFALGLYNFRAVMVAACFTNLRGLLRHDARTVWLIGNHHLLHHETGNVNYGDYWIDRLFGTAAAPERQVRGIFYV